MSLFIYMVFYNCLKTKIIFWAIVLKYPDLVLAFRCFFICLCWVEVWKVLWWKGRKALILQWFFKIHRTVRLTLVSQRLVLNVIQNSWIFHLCAYMRENIWLIVEMSEIDKSTGIFRWICHFFWWGAPVAWYKSRHSFCGVDYGVVFNWTMKCNWSIF